MAEAGSVKYYAMLNGQQCGPYTLEELVAAGVLPDTYIWCKGMKRWGKARDNGDVCRYFRQSLSDAMHPVVRIPEETINNKSASACGITPRRFQNMIDRSGETPEWLDDTPPDMSEPPKYFIFESILAALLCFPLTGIVALVLGIMSRQAWKRGDAPASYDLSRRARMTLGITLFLGLIVFAVALF